MHLSTLAYIEAMREPIQSAAAAIDRIDTALAGPHAEAFRLAFRILDEPLLAADEPTRARFEQTFKLSTETTRSFAELAAYAARFTADTQRLIDAMGMPAGIIPPGAVPKGRSDGA